MISLIVWELIIEEHIPLLDGIARVLGSIKFCISRVYQLYLWNNFLAYPFIRVNYKLYTFLFKESFIVLTKDVRAYDIGYFYGSPLKYRTTSCPLIYNC